MIYEDEKVIKEEIEDSTAIKSFIYYKDTMTLEIEFMHGGKYDYPGIDEDLVREWMGAESKGKFYNISIKPLGV